MKKQKSLTNKGFSLVELIIVVAILAILMAILAPQYLRYVERSRLQKDNTSLDEFAKAIKIACADEDVAQYLAGTAGVAFDFSDGTVTIPVDDANPTALEEELVKSIDIANFTLTSNTYAKSTAGYPVIHVTIDTSTYVTTVWAENYIASVGGTATGNDMANGFKF